MVIPWPSWRISSKYPANHSLQHPPEVNTEKAHHETPPVTAQDIPVHILAVRSHSSAIGTPGGHIASLAMRFHSPSHPSVAGTSVRGASTSLQGRRLHVRDTRGLP